MAHFIAREVTCIDRHIEPRNPEDASHYEEMTVTIEFTGSGNTTVLLTPDILTSILKKLKTVTA